LQCIEFWTLPLHALRRITGLPRVHPRQRLSGRCASVESFVFSASKGDPDYCSMPCHVQTVHRAAKSTDECFRIVSNVDFENPMFIKHISTMKHTNKSSLIIYGSNEQLLFAPAVLVSPRMSLFSRPSSSEPRPLAPSPRP